MFQSRFSTTSVIAISLAFFGGSVALANSNTNIVNHQSGAGAVAVDEEDVNVLDVTVTGRNNSVGSIGATPEFTLGTDATWQWLGRDPQQTVTGLVNYELASTSYGGETRQMGTGHKATVIQNGRENSLVFAQGSDVGLRYTRSRVGSGDGFDQSYNFDRTRYVASNKTATENELALHQSRGGNSASINQYGNENIAGTEEDMLKQTGWRNALGIVQAGDGDEVHGEQSGSKNSLSVFQYTNRSTDERSRNVVFNQEGNRNFAEIDQEDINGFVGIGPQHASLDQVGHKNSSWMRQLNGRSAAYVVQNGNKNIADVYVEGGEQYSSAYIRSVGYRNTALVSMDTLGNGAGEVVVVQAGGFDNSTDQYINGVYNVAEVMQEGEASNVDIEQAGNRNTALLSQTGDNNGAYIDQSLNRGLANVTQSGDNLVLTYDQSGLRAEGTIVQEGINNEILFSQFNGTSMIDQSGKFNYMSVSQTKGSLIVSQSGDNGKLYVTASR